MERFWQSWDRWRWERVCSWRSRPEPFTVLSSDAPCGAAHSSPSEAATKCINKCGKGGSTAVIVSDGKVYQLKGETAEVAKYLGQNVTVTGAVDGDTLTVVSVSKS